MLAPGPSPGHSPLQAPAPHIAPTAPRLAPQLASGALQPQGQAPGPFSQIFGALDTNFLLLSCLLTIQEIHVVKCAERVRCMHVQCSGF